VRPVNVLLRLPGEWIGAPPSVASLARTLILSFSLGWTTLPYEHRASIVAIRLISRLGPRFARRGVRRGTVVLAAPPGELHAVPVAIAANLLRWQNLDVMELGADTPAEALAEAVVGEPDIVAVGLACTTDGTTAAARRTIATMRRTSPLTRLCRGCRRR
jgi:methanogenic corrinoid protein MtbC1